VGPPPDAEYDRQAFEALIAGYADRLYSIASRITGSPEDAEDAVQDAALSAFQHWARFRGQALGSTWLYRITVNAALQRVRRRRPTEYLTETDYQQVWVADWSEDLARRVEQAELHAILERGIALLPEDLRVVLVLRDVEGLSSAESAAVLELTEAATKSRLHRARVLLRKYVADYLENR
jgi:RNA polymerase sigma-70 factor, ECF subfamily